MMRKYCTSIVRKAKEIEKDAAAIKLLEEYEKDFIQIHKDSRQELFMCLSSEYVSPNEIILKGKPKPAEREQIFNRSSNFKGICKNGIYTW